MAKLNKRPAIYTSTSNPASRLVAKRVSACVIWEKGVVNIQLLSECVVVYKSLTFCVIPGVGLANLKLLNGKVW